MLGTVSSPVDETEKGVLCTAGVCMCMLKIQWKPRECCLCRTEYKLHQCWEKVVECVLFVAAAVFLFS